MPKSIQEQIAGWCIHFTGIANKKCKAGIEYDSFGPLKAGVIPCLRGGSGTCQFCQYPTPEEVEAEVARGNTELKVALRVIDAAKEHYARTRQNPGVIKCPNGDHNLRYTVATSNGHFWISCRTCGVNMNE